VEGVPTLRTVSEWQSGALNAIRYRPRIDAARPATVVPEAVGRQGRRWASASRRGAVVWAVPFRLLWTGRRQFTGGASLLHRERAGGQRGSSPIIRIHDGDGPCPKIGGVEYGTHDRPEAERAVSRNRPPRVHAPIHYPRRYPVLDVDVDDHARRNARATRTGADARQERQEESGVKSGPCKAGHRPTLVPGGRQPIAAPSAEFEPARSRHAVLSKARRGRHGPWRRALRAHRAGISASRPARFGPAPDVPVAVRVLPTLPFAA